MTLRMPCCQGLGSSEATEATLDQVVTDCFRDPQTDLQALDRFTRHPASLDFPLEKFLRLAKQSLEGGQSDVYARASILRVVRHLCVDARAGECLDTGGFVPWIVRSLEGLIPAQDQFSAAPPSLWERVQALRLTQHMIQVTIPNRLPGPI